MSNSINISGITGSIIATGDVQGGIRNIVNMQNSTQESPDISKFIKELKEGIDSLRLSEEQVSELKAEVLTVEHQLDSPKPKNVIISESLKSVRAILEGVTGSALATGLLRQLAILLS